MENYKKLNYLTGMISILVSTICGFIVPHLIIDNFGSEVNGLISSINQFVGNASLLEGGITGIIIAKLYEPLGNKDEEKVSTLLNTANKFYKKITMLIFIYCCFLAVIFPLFLAKDFNPLFVALLVLTVSVQYVIQYGFSLTLKSLISADGSVYVISIAQTIINVANVILIIIVITIFKSIVWVKFVSSLLFLIQPVIYNFYVKRHFNYKNTNTINEELLDNKFDGISLNIATFIHYSTDIAVLTIFTDFKTVSIYSVYYLVISGLEAVVKLISNSNAPIIGKALYQRDGSIDNLFNNYENNLIVVVSILFTVAIITITPFVMVYTRNITDTNYCQPVFGYLFVLSEAVYLISTHHIDLASAANKFKEMSIPAYIEAFLNITISIVTVKKFGLVGVAFGTLVAMSFRLCYQVYLTKKIICRRSIIFYKKIIVIVIIDFILFVVLQKCLIFNVTIINWVQNALISTIPVVLINYAAFKFMLKESSILNIKTKVLK